MGETQQQKRNFGFSDGTLFALNNLNSIEKNSAAGKLEA
jgi:hypothetical protein